MNELERAKVECDKVLESAGIGGAKKEVGMKSNRGRGERFFNTDASAVNPDDPVPQRVLDKLAMAASGGKTLAEMGQEIFPCDICGQHVIPQHRFIRNADLKQGHLLCLANVKIYGGKSGEGNYNLQGKIETDGKKAGTGKAR